VRALLGALSSEAVTTTALKGATFGFLIACIACRHGLSVVNSTREIAVAGARSTLQATLACLIADALYTLGSVSS
jgi:ABC-type transporter Mla maintaining outer membrane lipid asymmetry permease subunit MlaE